MHAHALQVLKLWVDVRTGIEHIAAMSATLPLPQVGGRKGPWEGVAGGGRGGAEDWGFRV